MSVTADPVQTAAGVIFREAVRIEECMVAAMAPEPPDCPPWCREGRGHPYVEVEDGVFTRYHRSEHDVVEQAERMPIDGPACLSDEPTAYLGRNYDQYTDPAEIEDLIREATVALKALREARGTANDGDEITAAGA